MPDKEAIELVHPYRTRLVPSDLLNRTGRERWTIVERGDCGQGPPPW